MRVLKLKLILLFVTVIFILCLPLQSSAESRRQSFSFSLFGEILSNTALGTLRPLPITADVPEIEKRLENKGISFGLSLGYLILNRVEIQGRLTFGRSEIIDDVGIGLAGIPLGKTKVSDAKNFSYSGNIFYYLLLKTISPFLSAGVGGVTLNTSELGSSTKLFFDFGTGMRFKVTEHLAVFLELKDYLSFFNYPEDFDVFFVAIYDPEFSKSQHRLGALFRLSFTL